MILKFIHSHRSNLIAASIFAAFALTSAAAHAANDPIAESRGATGTTSQTNQSESRRFEKNPNTHVIKLDNTKGEHTLVLREAFLSPHCISGVGSNFAALAPGETGVIYVTEEDGLLSGCRRMLQDKHVTWQLNAVGTGTPALSYNIQLGIKDRQYVHWNVVLSERQIRIVSSDFGKPGTPYKATCGRRECLNEWAIDHNAKSAVIYFYRDGLSNPQQGQVNTSLAGE